MGHFEAIHDNIIACFVYKYSEKDIGLGKKEIARQLGISEASLQMRVGNFQALDGKGGLKNASRLSQYVYSQYRKISKKAHLKEVQQILQENSLWPGAA